MILGNNLGDYISNKERISVKAAKITHILLYILLGSVQEKKTDSFAISLINPGICAISGAQQRGR